jgi:dinuclear metal center YbgI/SA1388 family protein
MACSRQQLSEFLDNLLEPERFQDYCPNGLQVEGKNEIHRLVTGVTASQALVDEAIKRRADAILVHHGYFWRGEQPCLTGMKARRIRSLLSADINLFAYHLPLDWHPRVGNNVTLGEIMGVEGCGPLNPADTNTPVFKGRLSPEITVQTLAARLLDGLGREPLVIGEGNVNSIAWCTGAGQGYLDAAADAGADVFVTGEVSEQSVHTARERGIAFIAAGHHATERYGVQALGAEAAKCLGITHDFIEIDNPV